MYRVYVRKMGREGQRKEGYLKPPGATHKASKSSLNHTARWSQDRGKKMLLNKRKRIIRLSWVITLCFADGFYVLQKKKKNTAL